MTELAAGALGPRGPVAEAMADLWWVMLALGVAVFLLFAGLLAAGLLRRAPDEQEPEPPGGVGRWIVGGGVLLPAVVLIVVFAATVYAMRVIPTDAPSDALVVEVVGHQWWYEVHYPEQQVSTRDLLHLPVGRPIALQLTSADVIHSFWVPELGGKMDLLPDGTNLLVLEADEPGEYTARCAEFCGLDHAHMELTVVAQSADDFAAWAAEQR